MGYLKRIEERALSAYDPENIFVVKKAGFLFRVNVGMALVAISGLALHLGFEPNRRYLLIGDAVVLISNAVSIGLVAKGWAGSAGTVTAIGMLFAILLNNVIGDYSNPAVASTSRLMETLLLIFMVPPLVTSFAVKRSLIMTATILSLFVVAAHFLVLRMVGGVDIPLSFLVYLPLILVLGIVSFSNLKLGNEAIASLLRTKDTLSEWNAKLEKTIAERSRELQISEERHRLLAENANDVIWTMSLDGRITYVSPSVERIRGFTPDEAMKQPLNEILTPDSVAIAVGYFEELAVRLKAGLPPQRFHTEYEYYCKGGSTIWTDVQVVPHIDSEDQLVELLGVTRDISERKRSEDAIRRSLRENQALLLELQHRVKNSFNMISSMIHIASREGRTAETIVALEQLDFRVMSVAELYSLLYSSGSFAEVRLDEYCRKLALALLGLRSEIALVTDMEQVVVNAAKAAPIGLIVTELVTNSLKYAFPGQRKGKISLSLRKGPDRVSLDIRDDGVGLPKAFSARDKGGMGINLVMGLANQVGGSFAISGDDEGTRCTLTLLHPVLPETAAI
ncbi:MAG: sensor histidine kinase [Rectinemataceae bacterium]